MNVNDPVKITGNQWNEITKDVEGLKTASGVAERRLNSHSAKLDALILDNERLPMIIKQTIEATLKPLLDENNAIKNELSDIKFKKIQEEKDRAEKKIEEESERKRWFLRVILTCLITSVVGGILSFYIAVFLNNL